MNQKELIFRNNEGEEMKKCLLSREYPLLFVPSSVSNLASGDGGGWNQVFMCVQRDQKILENKSKEKQDKIEPISDPQAYNSLGLVDHDYGNHFAELKQKKLDKRIAIPKVRYSLENFVLDPIVLCQALRPTEASEYVNSFLRKDQVQSSNDENTEETKASETNNSAPNEVKDDKVLKRRETFFGICKRIREELETIIKELRKANEGQESSNISSQSLQNYLNEYFNFFEPVYDLYEMKQSKEPQKKDNSNDQQKSVQTCEKMQGEIDKLKASGADSQLIENLSNMLSHLIQTLSKTNNKGGKKGKANKDLPNEENNSENAGGRVKKLPEGMCEINILILKGFNRFITVQYPIKFLRIRGHDLVMGLTPKKEEAAKPIDAITNYVYTYGLTFVSEELVDVIIDLNNFAISKEPEDANKNVNI